VENEYFVAKIINWYEINKRNLPWRETTDPYHIWLSEIILQQTRVAQGLPYYYKFVETFPDIESLAKASQQEILRLWQGLGYYSRARNLHECAKMIIDNYNGKFPKRFSNLLTLKGIGDYTAAAIASFAFAQPVAVLDGNVFRVLSRYFGLDLPINTPAGKKMFQHVANELLPKDRHQIYNQAIMEFGALHCTPKNPICNNCVLAQNCEAKKTGLQNLLPVKVKKLKIKQRNFYYLVIRFNHKILLKSRNEKDIWKGLYDFYLIENNKENFSFTHLIQENLLLNTLAEETNLAFVQESVLYKHQLTHQKILARFYLIDIQKEETASFVQNYTQYEFYSLEEIANLPKPILIDNYLKQEIF
jgi:A/G-specific adenine glycosylase